MYESKNKEIKSLEILEIIFDDTFDVTLNCNLFTKDNLYLENVILCINFEELNLFLMKSKAEGKLVIDILAEKLSGYLEIPSIIDIVNILGNSITIESFNLIIYKAKEEDINGEWIDSSESIFFLEKIIPKEENNLDSYKLKECFNLLRIAYFYYNKLIDFGLNEIDARKKSGFKNEILFSIAKNLPKSTNDEN